MAWRAAGVWGTVVLVLTGCGVQGQSTPSTLTQAEEEPPGEEAASKPAFGGRANIVANPSFEESVDEWKPWRLNASVRAVATKAKDGRRAAEVRAKDIAPYGIESAPLVGYPERGDRYTLSAWLRTDDPQKNVVVRISENGGAFKAEAVAERRVRIGKEWREVTIRGRIRRNDRRNVSIYMFVLRSIRKSDTFLVDGVTFVRTPRGGS